MINNCKNIYIFLLLLFTPWTVTLGQKKKDTPLQFTENKGQWTDKVDFLLKGYAGDIYLEGSEITYNLYDKSIISDMHHGLLDGRPPIIKGHVYKSIFENSLEPTIVTNIKSSHYSNYFIGNDPDNWASDVFSYGEITYKNLYNNIDLVYYGHYGQLKYDLIVQPDGSPEDIKISYKGVDGLTLKNGHLMIKTSMGDVIEQSPYAYQIINGNKEEIGCHYKLTDGKLTFSLPDGYIKNIPLIIDPVLTFATYSGSSGDNFGCTASYDSGGNMYIGGTSFGFGYPTTVGAYQTSHGGGNTDMAISKLSPDGTSMIYSTYIGGVENEIPHSLVVNSNNELCILGTTGSINFPAVGGYDVSFNGGPILNFGSGYGFNYVNGCDIVVVKLSSGGNSIANSTFIGGSGNDGINKGSILHYNYGDAFRGEIIVDDSDNVYVASTTSSTDFPISGATIQGTYGGGGLDACLFKLSPNLNSLLWSSYLGGSNYDCAYSIQLGSNGDMYTTGGTNSTDIPTTAGVLNPVFNGGITDGFLAHINAAGNSLDACSYIGTSGYDQCFFVQTDVNDDVFVVGQTDGSYLNTAGTYGTPNSGQFIHKLTNDLTTTLLSTTVGRGSGAVDIAISAFLVSDCGPIYLSGWGGPLNGNTNVDAHASFSTTSGLPVAGGPFQTTTDGQDFYLMVLGEDASTLNYASFFGGGVSAEHVDGGTSRFDKNGKVYQAVCAGCGGNSDFPTTPGAWSNTNQAPNCNLGAFKFDLAFVTPVITATDPYACIPGSYTFGNSSQGANSFYWDFGDGESSTEYSPTHTYQDAGTYSVMLIGEDTAGCLAPDTSYLSLDVFEAGVATISTITDTICPNDTVTLQATGGGIYTWSPSEYVSDPNSASPMVFPPVTTTYQVIIDNVCLDDTLAITVYVYDEDVSVMPDTNICIGESMMLFGNGAVDYTWYPTTGMANPSSPTPDVSPAVTTTYYVDMLTSDGCTITDSVVITVDLGPPIPVVSDDITICLGDSVEVSALGAPFVHWYPDNIISSPFDSTTYVVPTTSSMVYVDAINGCGTVTDSVFITAKFISLTMIDDTIICPGDSVQLYNSGGGTDYNWTPSESLSDPTAQAPFASPTIATNYTLITTDICGSDTASVIVSLFENNTDALEDTIGCFGDILTLWASGGVSYLWYPDEYLVNENTATPDVVLTDSSWLYVDITTSNGCIFTDSTKVDVVFSVPQPSLSNDTTICQGDTVQIWASGAPTINWELNPYTALAGNGYLDVWPPQTADIRVEFINACGSSYDSVSITVIPVILNIVNDTIICPEDSAYLWSSGMDFYSWSPAESLSSPTSDITYAFPPSPTLYTVTGSDLTGCSKTADVFVDLYDLPQADAGEDLFIQFGDNATLDGTAFYDFYWTSQDSLSCTYCLNPTIQPMESASYVLHTTDDNGCYNSDTVFVRLDGVLYVPNAFTPDDDGLNDLFDVKGLDIESYRLFIFNRWGELIFESNDLNYKWDGTYKNKLVQIDTYVWKVMYTDFQKNYFEKIGHVSIIR